MRFLHTENIAAFNEALAKAQAKMGHAPKDATNTHFENKYPSLASVIEAIREPLTSEGISFMQWPDIDENRPVCVTRLSLKDQWIQASMPILGQLNGMQAAGSAYTYARRYSLMMLTGIAGADDDDDAEGAEGRQHPKAPRGQDRGRGGQASPGPSRGAQGAPPSQGGGQAPPPVSPLPADPKLAEEVRLLRQRREEAAKEKSRDKLLLADTAFAAFVEGYAATLREPQAVDALAGVCSELRFPKGPARDAIGAAINQARARIAAATQTT